MRLANFGSTLRDQKANKNLGFANSVVPICYLLLLGFISIHVYRTPVYSFDSLQYMGNAVLMEEHDPVLVHRIVYSEIDDRIPQIARENMLGHEVGAPVDQNRSLQERATNPYRFAQFFPCFAIRPMYNMVLYLVSKTGLGLVRAGILISASSHYFLGILIFWWLIKYVSDFAAFCIGIMTMVSPPLMELGRENTSDGLASLIAFAALYLIFQSRNLLPGLILLLASIYFRTDFVVLAGPVLLALCWERRLAFWQGAILSGTALASVFLINHFAGDYGLRMLYYRNFIGTPSAPGEMTVTFSFRDYLVAFRSGITLMANRFFIPFLLLGTVGVALRSRLWVIGAITTGYVMLHFIVLPNWDERWFSIFYLTMVVCAATVRMQGSTIEDSG